MAGTPKQEIQPANRALLHSAAVMEKSGIASGHHDILSITMKRHVWSVDVLVNLAPLAVQAGPGLGHLWPAKPSSDEAAGMECSGGVWSVATAEPPPYVGSAQAGGTLLLKRPRATSRRRPHGLICSVVEFIIFATSGQDRCEAAIAKISTGSASVVAAKTGSSGATRPSSG